MKHPNFFEGVAVAFAASVGGSVLYHLLTFVLPWDYGVRIIIAGLVLTYILYLLSRSSERTGRIVIMASWSIISVIAWTMTSSLLFYSVIHIGLIWLIRSLYFHSSLLSAVMDLGLNGLSLLACMWALEQSNSVFLSIWCLFLVQALFVAIPFQTGAKSAENGTGHDNEDRFQRAHRAAQAVLHNM